MNTESQASTPPYMCLHVRFASSPRVPPDGQSGHRMPDSLRMHR